MNTHEPSEYHEPPPVMAPATPPTGSPKSMTCMLVTIAAIIGIPLMLACVGILIAVMLPAVQAAREAARRTVCKGNMQKISIALLTYEVHHGTLPPAYTVDDSGRPLHSWRTLILPYMDQQALYDRIDLDKPWDDPANIDIAQTLIPVYQCPSSPLSPNETTYVAVVDPAGMFTGSEPVATRDATDGRTTTLMIVEASRDHAVSWMSPQDIDMPTFIDLATAKEAHSGGMHAVLADGAVTFMNNYDDPQALEAWITKAAND